MQELLAAVRRACSPAVWSRGVELSRAGAVLGERRTEDEIEVRVSTQGGMQSPLVTLYPEDAEWTCDCSSREDACVHVAAAVIAVNAAQKDGKALPTASVSVAKIGYRFSRVSGGLALERTLVLGPGEEKPLDLTLAAQARVATPRFVATQTDLAVEVIVGSRIRGLLSRQTLLKVLAGLRDAEDVRLDGQPVRVGEASAVMRAVLQGRAGGLHLGLIQDPAIREVFANGAVLMDKVLRPIGDLRLSGAEVENLRRGQYYAAGDDTSTLMTETLPYLRKHLPVDVQKNVSLPEVTRVAPRLVLQTSREADSLTVLPLLVYGDPPCARVDAGQLKHLQGPLPVRDSAAEQRLVQKLEQGLGMTVGIKVSAQGAAGVSLAQRIQSFGQGSSVAGSAHKAFYRTAALTPQLQLQGNNVNLHFELPGAAGAGPQKVGAAAVLQAWQEGQPLVALMEGGWAPLPIGWLDKHGQRLLDLLAAKANAETLPASALPDLARLYDDLNTPKPPALRTLQAQLQDFARIPAAVLPADLQASLRDYQRRGVNWMAFVRGLGMGAMLADDMGLGKTLQALCTLQGRTLVVAPTSVLSNWEAEAQRFRPGLRVCVYYGPQRKLDATANLTLTTYALLRLDLEALGAIAWDTAVLDEAQTIKNPESQVAQAAYQLRAHFRLTLTGTPVENRLDELWSQFHFLNRGLLGGRKDFQERYGRPIAEGEPGAAARLQERIRPFILRRLKRDVAPELPPRTDVVLRCTLSPNERGVYDAIRAATMAEVVERLQAGGSVMQALEALLRLRQAACHTGLVPGQEARTSAKVELLLETLDEIVAEGHKALVFSQWTGLLDRIEPHLQAHAIPFTRLDGSTADRGGVVQQFQQDYGPPVMLVSLKAGGTGLNLTAADHVFLLDPWWNPAVEDQAADRAHRIGQERPVLVHRLVAEDTVEERILLLQAEKRAVAQAALEGADRGASLTRDDLLALLS